MGEGVGVYHAREIPHDEDVQAVSENRGYILADSLQGALVSKKKWIPQSSQYSKQSSANKLFEPRSRDFPSQASDVTTIPANV